MDCVEYFGQTDPYVVDQERSYYRWFRKEAGFGTDRRTREELVRENQQLQQELSRIYAMKYWKFGKKVKSVLRKLRKK